jgi:hypothetical protein
MKRTALIISVLSLIILSTDAFASKLVWLKVVDNNYIMAQFKDGDAIWYSGNTRLLCRPRRLLWAGDERTTTPGRVKTLKSIRM